MEDARERPDPIMEDIEPEVTLPEAAEIVVPTASDAAPTFDDPGAATKHNDVHKRETLVLRRQYDAFVEQHREATIWQGVAQLGTVVAVEAGNAIMHVGRHHFVRFDIANDLHGRVPDVGVRIAVDASGAIATVEQPKTQTLERGLERGRER